MRSQKQVRRVGKVRSVKNAVAGKRKTYRKRLEARKAWQHNTIMTKRRTPNNLTVLLSTTHKKIKEPKQRSAEELAERQRLREQKRLEKELAKQRASTSAFPKIKKEKEVNEAFSSGVPKKTPNEQKAATKTTKAKKILMEDAAKEKYLKTEQTEPTVNVQQQAVDTRKTSEQKKAKKQQKSEFKSQSHQKLLVEEKGGRMEIPEGDRKSKPSTPKMSEEKTLLQSKTKISGVSKTEKKPPEKEEDTEQVVGKTRNDEVQSSIPISVVEKLQQKGTARDVLMGSNMDSDVKTDSSCELYEDRSLKQEWEVVQAEETMREDDQSEVNMGRGMAEGMNMKQKKKRNRQPVACCRLSDNDFIEGDAHEMDEEKANTDFTEVGGRHFKKKGHHDDQQSRYEGPFFEVKKGQEDVGRGGKDTVNEALAPPTTDDQNYCLVGPRFKTEGTVGHITLSSNEITKDDNETISKTEMSTEALSPPKELQMNMAGEYSELLSTASHDLNGAVNGKMTLKTYTKEAEREMNVEKREPIVLALERDSARRVQPIRERVYKLLPRDVQFCVRMIEKHGEDYEAMAKDECNTFRDSAKGIARKIRIFKESPQYEAYLKQKDDQKGPIS